MKKIVLFLGLVGCGAHVMDFGSAKLSHGGLKGKWESICKSRQTTSERQIIQFDGYAIQLMTHFYTDVNCNKLERKDEKSLHIATISEPVVLELEMNANSKITVYGNEIIYHDGFDGYFNEIGTKVKQFVVLEDHLIVGTKNDFVFDVDRTKFTRVYP